MKIKDVRAIEILDSRGNPTVRTILTLEDGSKHTASVPSGASTGSHEAVEMRDDDKTRHNGKGVLKAVDNVNTKIHAAIVEKEADPNKIDELMLSLDKTENKANLGANAMLSVSQAVVRAAAHAQNKPLWQFMNEYYFAAVKPEFPRLLVNIVNGGKHANWNFDIQEFMVVPNSNKPSEAVRIAAEIFHALGKSLKKKSLSTLLGDEGGYSPALNSNEEVLDTIIESAKNVGYENGRDFRLSLDVAATEFFVNGKYILKKTNETLTGAELTQKYLILNTKYMILSIEDPFAEDDWKSYENFMSGWPEAGDPRRAPEGEYHEPRTSGGGAQRQDPLQSDEFIIIGDDLFVTNPKRIKRGIEEKAANAVLIKINQIGTIRETAEAINMTHDANWKTAISHRSGETEDSFIADLAYACGSEFIKTGSVARSERLAKYNRLLEIEAGV